MMRIEYSKSDYKGTHIDIRPRHVAEIPGLRDMVRNNLMIENPARTFARKMNDGEFEGVPEDEITSEARMVNTLADVWGQDPEMNAIMLLSRALQMIADLTLSKKDDGPDEPDDSEWEDTVDEDEVPSDWFVIK